MDEQSVLRIWDCGLDREFRWRSALLNHFMYLYDIRTEGKLISAKFHGNILGKVINIHQFPGSNTPTLYPYQILKKKKKKKKTPQKFHLSVRRSSPARHPTGVIVMILSRKYLVLLLLVHAGRLLWTMRVAIIVGIWLFHISWSGS